MRGNDKTCTTSPQCLMGANGDVDAPILLEHRWFCIRTWDLAGHNTMFRDESLRAMKPKATTARGPSAAETEGEIAWLEDGRKDDWAEDHAFPGQRVGWVANLTGAASKFSADVQSCLFFLWRAVAACLRMLPGPRTSKGLHSRFTRAGSCRVISWPDLSAENCCRAEANEGGRNSHSNNSGVSGIEVAVRLLAACLRRLEVQAIGLGCCRTSQA